MKDEYLLNVAMGKKQCTHETNDDRLNFAMEKHNDLLMKNDGLLNFAMEKLMIYL
jgi:hypothetical protein